MQVVLQILQDGLDHGGLVGIVMKEESDPVAQRGWKLIVLQALHQIQSDATYTVQLLMGEGSVKAILVEQLVQALQLPGDAAWDLAGHHADLNGLDGRKQFLPGAQNGLGTGQVELIDTFYIFGFQEAHEFLCVEEALVGKVLWVQCGRDLPFFDAEWITEMPDGIVHGRSVEFIEFLDELSKMIAVFPEALLANGLFDQCVLPVEGKVQVQKSQFLVGKLLPVKWHAKRQREMVAPPTEVDQGSGFTKPVRHLLQLLVGQVSELFQKAVVDADVWPDGLCGLWTGSIFPPG
jgi:hypothetical protein